MRVENKIDRPLESLPDLRYFVKAIRRNILAAAVASTAVLIPGGLTIYRARDIYRSSATVVYDQRDGFLDSKLGISDASVEMTERAFSVALQSPDFAERIINDLQINTTGRLTSLLVDIGITSEETKSERQARLTEWFTKRVEPQISWGSGVLTLTVMLDDHPSRAQEIAAASIEKFTSTYMEGLSDQLSGRLDILEDTLAGARQNLRRLQGITESTSIQGKSTKAKSMDFRTIESQYLDKIKLAEEEVASLGEAKTRRRTQLENEYQRLAAQLTPSHPELAIKRREIDEFVAAGDPAVEASYRLSKLRRDLLIFRSQSSSPRTSMDPGFSGLSLEEQAALERIADLAQKLDLFRLERDFLRRQIRDPASLTRFRTVKHASYEPRPIRYRRVQAVVGVLSAAIMTFLATVFVRERLNPLARDDWRVMRATGYPVLAQISADGLAAYPKIDEGIARNLRELLWKKRSETSLGVRVILAYRRIELALANDCEGELICLLGTGSSKTFHQATESLFAIIALDQSLKSIVLDFTLSNTASIGSDATPDLLDCLGDPTLLSNAVLLGRTNNEPDYLRISADLSPARWRSINQRQVTILLSTLTSIYDRVFVRGLPDHFFIENSYLSNSATDTLLLVDSQSTTIAELRRSLDQCRSERLRGLVLLGT